MPRKYRKDRLCHRCLGVVLEGVAAHHCAHGEWCRLRMDSNAPNAPKCADCHLAFGSPLYELKLKKMLTLRGATNFPYHLTEKGKR